jgi:2-keto-3-deoxy-L-fuconate dehydrogenase
MNSSTQNSRTTGRLDAKVAVITGGGSGIGQATAAMFAAEGASVFVVDQDGDGAEATAAMVRGAGTEAATFVGDVTEAETAERGAAAALERFGRVDVLMTAAGISVGRSVVDTDPDDWDRVFAVNVRGTYLWMRSVLPSMLEQGSGSVILVASQLGVAGGMGNAAYIASKGAIIALARTAAVDYATRGVRVNSILPGATETPLLDRSFGRVANPEAARARSLARHPMGRFGRAEEVAAGALYLASDESSYTTGTELRVDGGWLAG